MKKIFFICMTLFFSVLTSCGQYGALYLPQGEKANTTGAQTINAVGLRSINNGSVQTISS